jgi:hypothetical protein
LRQPASAALPFFYRIWQGKGMSYGHALLEEEREGQRFLLCGWHMVMKGQPLWAVHSLGEHIEGNMHFDGHKDAQTMFAERKATSNLI